ncbi:MAG: hypothetical protein DRI61_03380 [Chloroflexi bacterium]|nr:MAG: hypothetical protein DRI61_03380 [Chloroflexota bacterium]
MKRMSLIVLLVILSLTLMACQLEFSFPKLLQAGKSAPTAPATAVTEERPVVKPTPTPKRIVVAGKVLDAEEEQLLVSIYERVNPSVVNIRVTKKVKLGEEFRFPNIVPELPFATPPEEFFQEGVGSGFVWDEEGHIVTNYHVVEGADEVEVTFYNGDSTLASVVGTDPDSDVAVIKVDELPQGVHPVDLGDSDQVKVGQRAIAIGNPFGLQGTMTVGIISGLGRVLRPGTTQFSIPEVIQTDAAINPGNSGGPLLDSQGRVIGINTAIKSPVRASAGVGFAVPINLVKKVVPSLIERGYYEYPWLGIRGMSVTRAIAEEFDLPVKRGALVIEVIRDSPADKAGLQGAKKEVKFRGEPLGIGGDIIIAIDGQEVRKFEDLLVYLVRNTTVGQEVTLTVIRDGEEKEIKVKLGKRPKVIKE